MNFSFLPTIGWIIAAILAVLALIWGAVTVYRYLLRKRFEGKYGIEVPRKIKVSRSSNKIANALVLGTGAFWLHANKDGTADKRRSDNKVLYSKSNIFLGGFRLTGNDQFAIYRLAIALRRQQHPVGLDWRETEKAQQVQAKRVAQSRTNSVEAIYDRFANDPFGFERYVGEVLTGWGHSVEVTPPTNDGGFDLKATRNGRLEVVECKCFEPSSAVGRPVIQKLVGAGAGVGAQGAMVVTTARYTQNAIDYAAQMRVKLVDGQKLFELARQVGLADTPANSANHNGVDWMLDKNDLLREVPSDLLHRYRSGAR